MEDENQRKTNIHLKHNWLLRWWLCAVWMTCTTSSKLTIHWHKPHKSPFKNTVNSPKELWMPSASSLIDSSRRSMFWIRRAISWASSYAPATMRHIFHNISQSPHYCNHSRWYTEEGFVLAEYLNTAQNTSLAQSSTYTTVCYTTFFFLALFSYATTQCLEINNNNIHVWVCSQLCPAHIHCLGLLGIQHIKLNP